MGWKIVGALYYIHCLAGSELGSTCEGLIGVAS
jgi:hypothetical protein